MNTLFLTYFCFIGCAGFYGPNCSIPCPTNCKERRCGIIKGHCLDCAAGYQGLKCEKSTVSI